MFPFNFQFRKCYCLQFSISFKCNTNTGIINMSMVLSEKLSKWVCYIYVVLISLRITRRGVIFNHRLITGGCSAWKRLKLNYKGAKNKRPVSHIAHLKQGGVDQTEKKILNQLYEHKVIQDVCILKSQIVQIYNF